MKVKFVFERPTKNTCVYVEEPEKLTDPVVVGTLYVQKEALKQLKPGGGTPDILFVEITAV